MAKRLFVDCDDTLVLYQNDNDINPYGYYLEDPWNPNVELIDAIADHYLSVQLYIWSGGGQEYAAMWARSLFSPRMNRELVTLSKGRDTIEIVREGDIVIDDMNIRTRGTLYTPFDLGWIKELG